MAQMGAKGWLCGLAAGPVSCLAVAGSLLIGGCTPAVPGGGAGSAGPAAAEDSAALAALDALPVVAGSIAPSPYDRDAFGQRWSDDVSVAGGHNGCDTRNDQLARDLSAVEYKPGTHDCVVQRGILHDPYTGAELEFRRGVGGTAAQVHIDHVVALANAWGLGAATWEEARRQDFANDPENLQSTTAAANKEKGAADASKWLPPSPAYHCTYAKRQVQVKAKYQLAVTSAERAALEEILRGCP